MLTREQVHQLMRERKDFPCIPTGELFDVCLDTLDAALAVVEAAKEALKYADFSGGEDGFISDDSYDKAREAGSKLRVSLRPFLAEGEK